MNKLNNIKRVLFALVMCLSLTLCGCGSNEQTEDAGTSSAETQQSEDVSAEEVMIDYGDAESFEAALNEGKNLEGKVVRFIAGEFHPQSKLGYNVWAGEHLNFVSSRNPDIKEGDTVTVKTTTIENMAGSWVINYEKVENAVITDDTVTYSKPKETTAATTTAKPKTTTTAATTAKEETTEAETSAPDEPAEEKAENTYEHNEYYDIVETSSFQNSIGTTIGTGVILLCVTVSVVTGGVGAPAVSMIFAASAKSATVFALSSGVISGVSAGVVEGIQTHDFDKAVKAAALKGSEGYMWGACTGAITGGASEAIALKGATLNGLTMNQAATIQKESKYPIDVIKQFSNMEQFEICQKAGLTADMVNGKTALIRNIDLNFVDEATGLTNLERMQQGLAALDPSGKAYELHHIGQHADSTLAILTQEEHRLGDSYKIWHELVGESEIDRAAFDKIRQAFWQNLAKTMG